MSAPPRSLLFAEFLRDAAAGEDAPHGAILRAEAESRGGSVLSSTDALWQVAFASPAQAVACALAVQGRLCEHNRESAEAGKVSARMSLHEASSAQAGGPVAEAEAELLARLLEAAPPGRVLATRKVYAKALGRNPCAFIPLGLEYFKGLSDPVEVFEAAPALELDPDAPLPGAEPSVPPLREARAQPSHAPEQEGTLQAPITAAAALLAAWALYAARKPLGTALGVFDPLNHIFHIAGHTLFSLTGSAEASAAGGLLVLAAMPAALVLHARLNERPLLALAGAFWLGQVSLCCGRALTLGRLDPDSFAGCLQNDLRALLAAAGLEGVSFSAGRAALILGCLLLAFALVRGILRFTQGETHGG